MTVSSHLEELRRKHESLSAEVDDAQRHASMDSLELATMKKQKLKIKEEIERLQTQ